MAQFCYLKLFSGVEALFRRLLKRMERMDRIETKTLGQFSSFNAITPKITKKIIMLSAP